MVDRYSQIAKETEGEVGAIEKPEGKTVYRCINSCSALLAEFSKNDAALILEILTKRNLDGTL